MGALPRRRGWPRQLEKISWRPTGLLENSNLERADAMAKHHSLSGNGSVHTAGGDIMGSGAGMSPRKAMASGMGAGSGNFGVKDYVSEHGATGSHPDAKAMTGTKGAMADSDRGIPCGGIQHTKGMHPAQPAPDHGSTHPGGHGMHAGYGGKV